MRVLHVSGGSAGHLAPLVAVAKAVAAIDPKAEQLFLCSDRPEDAEYLRGEGVTFRTIPRPRRALSLPKALVQNFRASSEAMRAFKPDVIFSKGGATSVPACFAARRLKIPIVLHESDAIMGTANRIAARWAKKICLGFPLSAQSLQPTAHGPFIVTGNPLRPGIDAGSRAEGLRRAGLDGKKPVLLVIGGSQGAEALNAFVRTNIDALLAVCDIMHLTGKGKTGAEPRPGYFAHPFAREELPDLYAAADLALSRAGAGAIGELAACGIPTILVPIEGLAGDHQVLNAQTALRSGGCLMLRQELLPAEGGECIEMLARDDDRRKKMSHDIRSLHVPDASRRIAEILVECIAPSPARD